MVKMVNFMVIFLKATIRNKMRKKKDPPSFT